MHLNRPGIRSHYFFILFYILFLIAGLSIYKDYGIPWDETACRKDVAIVNADYIFRNQYESLMNNNAKYHGPAFELTLYGIENLLHLKDTRGIYLMRHLANFLLFAIAVLFFYLLCQKRFKTKWIAAMGPVLLVLSPRIFADAFYNSKDLAFLSFVVISLYTTTIFLERKNYLTGFIHALVLAYMVDIRVMGIIIPLFTGLMLVLDLFKYPNQRKRLLLLTSFFLVCLIGFIILFWPVLWRNPVEQFILAFKENSKFPWEGYVLYRGNEVPAVQLPRDYILYWILISTPVLYLFLFSVSVFLLVRKIIRLGKLETSEWLHVCVIILPLISVIFLHAVVYDGWRHLYFIYPSFIFIVLITIEAWQNRIANKKIILAFDIGLTAYSIFILITMVRLHPFENLYFNFVAGKSLNEVREKFEMDYWGLSYKQGIEYVLKSDTSSNISLCCTEPPPGIYNTNIFSERDKARLSFTYQAELADFVLTAYRYIRGPFKYKADLEIDRDHGAIHSVFDVRNKKLDLSGEGFLVSKMEFDYESPPQAWFSGRIVKMEGAYSGNGMEVFDSASEFGTSVLLNPPNALIKSAPGLKYLDMNFMIKTTDEIDGMIVFQLDSGLDKTYEWKPYVIQSTLKNTWMKKEFRLRLPDIYSVNDRIKIFLWNPERKHFYVDNLSVKFYSVPEEVYNQVNKNLP